MCACKSVCLFVCACLSPFYPRAPPNFCYIHPPAVVLQLDAKGHAADRQRDAPQPLQGHGPRAVLATIQVGGPQRRGCTCGGGDTAHEWNDTNRSYRLHSMSLRQQFLAFDLPNVSIGQRMTVAKQSRTTEISEVFTFATVE